MASASGKLLSEVKSLAFSTTVPPEKTGEGIDLEEEVKVFEIKLMERALERVGGNQRLAAQLLNLKNTTLNAKIKRYSIHCRKEALFSSAEQRVFKNFPFNPGTKAFLFWER